LAGILLKPPSKEIWKMARILVIDDEPAILMLLKRILTGAGHEVLTATEGGAGLLAAAQETVDLILSDLSMPGEPSGVRLLAAIRKARPACPLVVVSGYSSQDCVDECTALGIRDFLPKPFEIGFVRAFVGDILRRG
jgi:CheY-like chemotaxis protein